jgi:hypothetical protein
MSKALEMNPSANLNRQTALETIGDNLQERIQQRAYELYEERGSQPGHELEDWTQAETEILRDSRRPRAA